MLKTLRKESYIDSFFFFSLRNVAWNFKSLGGGVFLDYASKSLIVWD